MVSALNSGASGPGLSPGRGQGLTLEKQPWGQLAPKFLDLFASAKFFLALQGSKFIFYFRSTCETRCKFLGALPKCYAQS